MKSTVSQNGEMIQPEGVGLTLGLPGAAAVSAAPLVTASLGLERLRFLAVLLAISHVRSCR